MATIGSEEVQVEALDANTVTIGGADYVKFTAGSYWVETSNSESMLMNPDNMINILEDGVPMSIQGGYEVIDEEPFTISLTLNGGDYGSFYINGNAETGTPLGGNVIELQEGDEIDVFWHSTSSKISSVGYTAIFDDYVDAERTNITMLLRPVQDSTQVYWYRNNDTSSRYYTINRCTNNSTDSYLPSIGDTVYDNTNTSIGTVRSVRVTPTDITSYQYYTFEIVVEDNSSATFVLMRSS